MNFKIYFELVVVYHLYFLMNVSFGKVLSPLENKLVNVSVLIVSLYGRGTLLAKSTNN